MVVSNLWPQETIRMITPPVKPRIVPAAAKPKPKPTIEKEEKPEEPIAEAPTEEVPVAEPKIEEAPPEEAPVAEAPPEEVAPEKKPPVIDILEYQLSWYQKELDNYKKALEEATEVQKKALNELITAKQTAIDTLQKKIDDEKRKKSEIIKLQEEIEVYTKEISSHKEKLSEAPEAERAAIQALITLKQGLIDAREDQIKQLEKEQILKKPISYLENVLQLLEKEVEQHKKDLETVEETKKAALENTIETKQQLIEEIKKSIEKRKKEQAEAPAAVSNWQEQKEILEDSIGNQNFIKDRVAPSLKKVIDANVTMKEEAIKQLDENIGAGTTGGEITKVAAAEEDDDFFEEEPTTTANNDFDDTQEIQKKETVGEKRIQEIAQKIMPEIQQDTYTAKIGVPSSSPLGQTFSINNDMASSLAGPISTLQSQAQSTIQENTQKAIERVNIFKGEARELEHKDECLKRLQASGCYRKSRKCVPCKTVELPPKIIKTCDVDKLLKEFGCPVKNG